jgi:cation:H+ antiporter
MLIDVALLLLGLLLLFAGGEALVRGAVSLAARLGVPEFLIGLTVVGFGTSMPELMVSVEAALLGSTDIAIGNVVGSNTANILLILGVSALIAPMAAVGSNLRRDMGMMVAAAVLLLALGFVGEIGRVAGAGMLLSLTGYLVYAGYSDRVTASDGETVSASMSGWKEAAFVVAGLCFLLLGADFLVGAAIGLARAMAVSEAVIGLTIVAVGTSLPELATSVTAALRRNPEIALGNVIGSNIFNIAGILGVTAVVKPIPISTQMTAVDIPFMLAVSVMLVVLYLALGKLTRGIAVAFLISYAAYVLYLV